MRFHYRYGKSWSSIVADNAQEAIESILKNVGSVDLIQFRNQTLWEKKDETKSPVEVQVGKGRVSRPKFSISRKTTVKR